jgi:phosphohistidine phosphatase
VARFLGGAQTALARDGAPKGQRSMPMLHLLRHAKASADGDLEDSARPLTRRGVDAARRVGQRLPAQIGPLDLVLCSPARRTLETMEFVLADYSAAPRRLVESELYLADSAKLLARLARLDEEERNVLLIGHNPGLRDLALSLAETRSQEFAPLAAGKFPTAARASFDLATPWRELGFRRHPLVAYVTPKSLK